MLFYMLQIYLDFSAYSDMAIGMGQMVGFHYLENFNYHTAQCLYRISGEDGIFHLAAFSVITCISRLAEAEEEIF